MKHNIRSKIAIQGWFAAQPFTGIGQHTLVLAEALSKVATVTLVTPKKITGFSNSNIAQKKIPAKPSLQIKVIKPKSALGPLKKWYWEYIQVPAYLAKQKLDLEYYPYPCPIQRISTHKRAMTVHDLIPWNDSRYKGGRLKTHYYKKALYSLLYVDTIFTVSETVRRELGIASAKLLPNALSENFLNLCEKTAPEKPSLKNSPHQKSSAKKSTSKHNPALNKFQLLNSKYLVYLGGYDVRKNINRLITEFKTLRKKIPEMKLVLIGEAHHRSSLYPKFSLPENAIQTGNISDKEVCELLKNAFAFIHFSDSEGFNIPLLQAMAAGCPAVINDIPVNREVSKNSALFFKASQKSSLTANILKLRKTGVREKIIHEQFRIAKKYSAKKSAQIILRAAENNRH